MDVTRPIRLRNAHPSRRDPRYFHKLFRQLAPYNFGALRLDEGLTFGETATGRYMMRMTPGELIETTIFAEKAWEPHVSRLAGMVLARTPGVVLDIGANIGASTVPLAIQHPDCRFHCFEPHPLVFEKLKANIGLNRLTNVRLMNSAVSDDPGGTLRFFAQKNADNMGLSSLSLNPDIRDYDEILVGVVGVDRFLVDVPGRVVLMKIDTQGHEARVLASARETIRRDRPVVIFEFEDEYFGSERDLRAAKDFVHDFFAEQGYLLYSIQAGVDFNPRMDIRSRYNGDILAVPAPGDAVT